MTPYYAHSVRGTPPGPAWQTLADHLRGVAKGAADRAAATKLAVVIGFAELARAAGWLHDLGKYRTGFQTYITTNRGKGDPETYHKQAGAARAASAGNWPLASAVAGHHGGLPDFDNTGPKADLRTMMQDAAATCHPAVTRIAAVDCPDAAGPVPPHPVCRDKFHLDLVTRLLFSCLVDADWADTGAHDRRARGLPPEPAPPPLDASVTLTSVLSHIATKAAGCPEGDVKRVRADVLAACLAAAESGTGVFTLTVPTGGGKTLAALAFALAHAAKNNLRRVVYVAPYMSILDQNLGVFRDALGVTPDDPAVFAHYSLADPPGDAQDSEAAREAAARRAENWDAPVVVTTNVQFFESLFANQPGLCRKLHNVARSVVVLDECQTLPPGLAGPTCGMLRQFAEATGTTIVLCTATQPAFDHPSLKADERLAAAEIVPAGADLFGRLKRVTVHWPTGGPLDWPAVAARMVSGDRTKPRALCVVNTKKAARAVYAELVAVGGPVGVFHLSTGMCPAHRVEKLAAIRARLRDGKKCLVSSTQLIEAGVDVEFPLVLREMAPFEAVIQAAGRCNREGKLPGPAGRVEVFRSVDGALPPDAWYRAGRGVLETILANANGVGPQVDDPAAIADYFTRLYQSGKLDAHGIRTMREKFQFQTVAETYRLIESGEAAVVATWCGHEHEVEKLLAKADQKNSGRAAYRALAKYQVNLLPSQLAAATPYTRWTPGGLLVWDGKYADEVGIEHEQADNWIV